MRQIAILVLVLISVPTIAGPLDDMEMWKFYIQIAEQQIEEGHPESALALYTLLLEKRLVTPSDRSIAFICDSLVNNIDPQGVDTMPQGFWVCPKELIRPWADRNPVLIESPPKPKWCRGAAWPWWAKVRDLKGKVTLTFEITEKGTSENIKVLDSTHWILKRVSVRSVKKCTFFPATEYGVPVKSPYKMSFTYQ